jgi:hypothetical protein
MQSCRNKCVCVWGGQGGYVYYAHEHDARLLRSMPSIELFDAPTLRVAQISLEVLGKPLTHTLTCHARCTRQFIKKKKNQFTVINKRRYCQESARNWTWQNIWWTDNDSGSIYLWVRLIGTRWWGFASVARENKRSRTTLTHIYPNEHVLKHQPQHVRAHKIQNTKWLWSQPCDMKGARFWVKQY